MNTTKKKEAFKETLKFAFIQTVPVLFGYVFMGIAFGILLEPEYLTGLLRAMQNAGFRVTVSGNNNEALRTRDYDMTGGFTSRSGRSASSARRFQ